MKSLPLVSIVIPARDEGRAIERAIRSALDQTYPSDLLEVIVAIDGGSRDDTYARVQGLARSDERIKVHAAAGTGTPTVLNEGIAVSRGSIIARVDAHGWIDSAYIQTAVNLLADTDAAAVGGVAEFVGASPTGRAIALAMGSKLGAGTAAFRTAAEDTQADTLMWGVYRRELFDQIGRFDEALLRNQDDEFCFRVRQAGGRLVVTPRMRFFHEVRSSYSGLWRQYCGWGRYRVVTIAKHGRPATPRQMVPAALVATLAAACAATPAARTRPAALSCLGAYGCVVAGAAVNLAVGASEKRIAPRVVGAIGVMQIAYGAGFWLGIAKRAMKAD